MAVIISSTVRCPYPTCGHTGDIITNLHCRSAHKMERKELFGKFGKPQSIGYDPLAANKNLASHTPIQRLNIGYPSDTAVAKDRRTTRSRGR